MLSDRLAGLVDAEVLERRPDRDRPGRHIYELTSAGRELSPALYALVIWGDRHLYRNARTYKHAACRSTLDEHGCCPQCGLTPGPEDILTVPRRGRRGARNDPVAVALRKPHRLLEPVDV